MAPALARPGGRVSSGNGGGWLGVLPFLIYIVVYIFTLPYASMPPTPQGNHKGLPLHGP